MHPTLITSRKNKKKKRESPAPQRAKLGRTERCSIFEEIFSSFNSRPPPPLPPTTICQTESGKSKAGGRKEVWKGNSCKKACELVSRSLLKWCMARWGAYMCTHMHTDVRPFLGSGLGGRWCQNLSCCQEQSSRCPAPLRLERKAAKPRHQKKKKKGW